MSMSKKDFIALSDALRNVGLGTHGNPMVNAREQAIISALCLFLRKANPAFNEDRWRAYLAGTVGPSGGALRRPSANAPLGE